MSPFSAAARPAHLTRLRDGVWDLLVIGGGITGAGIAHDAASRGLRVALVEAGDLGGGTSGRSSRLVHGGLRYLETFDFHLVWEASAERARLLRLAPHLVRPLPFLFPVYRGGPVSPAKLRAGMWLYDLLSAFQNIRRHRMLDAAEVAREEPALGAQGLLGAALYYDASVDDARLTLAAARAAAGAGATVVSYAEVTAFQREGDRLAGVVVRDRLSPTAAPVEVSARVLLNATGPWSDRIRRLADPAAEPRLRTTKGAHVMLRRARVGNRNAVTLRSPVDGRVMFVLPWGEHTYVGTTDTDYRGDPGDVRADAADVRYLLDSANAMFPHARLEPADVLSTWAGVRPLLAPRGEVGESATSREHEIWTDPGGLLNIAGGKLTTFRVMARQAVDAAVRTLPPDRSWGPCVTARAPLPGAPPEGTRWLELQASLRAAADGAGLDPGAAASLAERHGTDAPELFRLCREQPELAGRIHPSLPYRWAEAVFAVRAELALTLEDVMVRRTHLFYEADDGGSAAAEAVATRLAGEPGIGWSRDEVRDQVERYRLRVAESRGFPA